jgi:uncharacterized protein (TIGR03435 family)
VKKIACLFAFGAGFAGMNAPAQPAGAVPSFEVASIKPSPPGVTGATMRLDPGGRFVATGMTIRNLIQLSFGTKDYNLVGGPSWLSTLKYDIIATTAHTAAAPQKEPSQQEQMLKVQQLLLERFHLTMHREMREMAVYVIVQAPAGPKMKEAGAGGVGPGDGQVMPVRILATLLTGQLGRPVLDKTGLNGNYYVRLKWTSDDGQPRSVGVAQGQIGPTPADIYTPSIFTAISEQLGLKLEAAKSPMEVSVIDSIQQPAAN